MRATWAQLRLMLDRDPVQTGWPIRAHLALFGAMLLAPAIVFSAFLIHRSSLESVARAEARVVHLATELADNISNELERGITILQSLALSGSLERGELEALHAHARRILEPHGEIFLLVDTAGRQLVNTHVPWGRPLPAFGDPASLARVIETRAPHVSNLFFGRTRNIWVVNILFPTMRDGQVDRILALSLSAERILSFVEGQTTEPDWFGAVYDRGNITIAHSLTHAEMVGRPMPPELASAGLIPGTAHRAKSIDGRPIVRAVARTRLADWTVSAGVTEAKLRANAAKATRDLVLGGLALLLLTAALVGIQGQRLARSIRSVSRPILGDGPEPAAVAVREVNEAAALLVNAVRAVKERDAALRLALTAASAEPFTREIDDELMRCLSRGQGEPAEPPNTPFGKLLASVHGEDRERFVLRVKQAIEEGSESYRNEFRVEDAGGAVRWVEEWGRVETDPDGATRRLAGISLDVTDRKRSALELELSAARLRLASEAAAFGTYDYDIVTGENFWSPMARELAGLGPDEPVLLERVYAAIHPGDRDRVRAKFEQAIAPGGPVELEDEHRLARPDGAVRWVRLKGRTFLGSDGRPVRAAGTIIDVTKEKAAALALLESERRFRELADSMPQLVWMADSGGHVIYFNRRREEYRRAPRCPNEWAAIVHPDDLERTRTRWLDAVRTLKDYECEHRVLRNDGRFRWQLSRARAVQHGDRVLWYGTATDIHDLKEREERIGILLREVNHRSKNLLSVVLSIARQTSRQGSAAEFSEQLTERVQGLSASQDLLIKSEWRGAELGELVRAQIARHGDAAGERIEIEGPELVIHAAAAQAIGMAIHELAANAARHGALSQPRGRVTISWQIDRGVSPTLQLAWRERGGPPVTPPSRTGFGFTVLGRTAEQALGAKVQLDTAAEGLSWVMTAPLERLELSSVE